MLQFIQKTLFFPAALALALAPAGCATKPQQSPTSAPDALGDDPAAAAAALKAPRFEKVPVGGAGFEAYVPKGFPAFTSQLTDDGSLVESAQLERDGFTFALIGVKLSQAIPDGADSDAILGGYLEHIKSGVDIEAAAGYGIGHRLESAPEARGIIDYWKTKDGQTVSVKGWITKHHIAVYTIWGDEEYPFPNVQAMFFDGPRFPVSEAD